MHRTQFRSSFNIVLISDKDENAIKMVNAFYSTY